MNLVSRNVEVHISLMLVLFTTTSYSIKGLALFAAALGLYFLRYPSILFSRIHYGPIIFVLIFSLLPVYSALIGEIYLYEHVFKFYFLIVSSCGLMLVLKHHRRVGGDIYNVINCYVYVVAFLALLQLAMYMIFGTFLDYYGFLRERYGYSAYELKELSDALIPIRITGIYSEPSFLAMALLPALGYFLYVDRVKTWSFALTLLVVALSMSTAALLVTMIMLVTYSLFKLYSVKMFMIVSGFCFLLALTGGPLVYERITEPKTYDALASRLHIFQELSVRDPGLAMHGSGIFLDEFGSNNGVTGLSAAEVRDTGFIFHILYSLGYVGLFLVCLVIMSCVFISGGRIFLFMPLLLLKYGFLLSTFYIVLIFLFISFKGRRL